MDGAPLFWPNEPVRAENRPTLPKTHTETDLFSIPKNWKNDFTLRVLSGYLWDNFNKGYDKIDAKVHENSGYMSSSLEKKKNRINQLIFKMQL